MGYEFTVEELTKAANEEKELTPEELENAAGGSCEDFRDFIKNIEVPL